MADVQLSVVDTANTQVIAIPGENPAIVLAVGDTPALVTSIPGPQGPAGAVAAAIDGSAAFPSIAFASDPGTGLYRVGANQLGISTGGTQRLVIDASGNINADSGTFYVDAVNNRVGIGTASPGNSLAVVGNLINGLQGTGAINVVSNTTTNNGADATPSIGFSAPYNTSATRVLYGAIQARKSNSNAGNTSGYLSFLTSPTSSTGVIERLTISGIGTTTLTSAASTAPFIANIGASEVARIDSSGRLLVGTASGSALLQVNGTLRAGDYGISAGVLGNNATMLASTPPSGAVAAEIMCYGKDYSTLNSNTHTGFLLAYWSADTNTITTITSTNHSAGTSQGFEAIWSGTQIVVRNKAGMTANQRGRAFVRYLA